ncbi:hypothetical protein Moror_9590 [Moniliophthora roreri MCA 2997]|uniref:DUF6534 domain-containing protein n=1 Tax=Moniliophthora roreri (strain MCA 2997) TaxID=1381753 RepID=V2XF07_MONRO|nr:hypothetical protein Moror_9590 [Moniliophthora roreri MCA 2997]
MNSPPTASPGSGNTMDPLALLPKAFDNTLGALLVGGLVAMALWGITCVQTFNYFDQSSRRDKPQFKLLASISRFLDTFDTVLNCHILYFYLVSNYINPLAIMVPIWSVIIHVAVTSVSNFIIRSLFARRAYRLGKNIPSTIWIVAVSLTDLVVGLLITIKAFGISTYLELDTLSSLMYLNFAAGTTSDLSVALVLCYLLWKSKTGFTRTDSLIKMLMAYTINTGLIVAIDAALGMICYAVMPNNFIFLGFYLLLSKLYLNSYLASLNARDSLREKSNGTKSFNLSEFSPSAPRFNVSVSHPSSEPTAVGEKSTTTSESVTGISIQTVVKQHTDEESLGSSDYTRSGSGGNVVGLGQAV